jgi:hypothetical protein
MGTRFSASNLTGAGYGVSFPGVKRRRRGADQPHPPMAEVKEIVELHLWTSMVAYGVKFNLKLYLVEET